jgi:hypothetical protein
MWKRYGPIADDTTCSTLPEIFDNQSPDWSQNHAWTACPIVIVNEYFPELLK